MSFFPTTDKKRGDIEIKIAILLSCYPRPRRITHIMRRANLAHESITSRLAELQKKGLLLKLKDGKTTLWVTSDDGREVIKEFHLLRRLT